MKNIKSKRKNGVIYKKFEELEIGDMFLSDGELWIKTERKNETWFYHPENKYYYYINSLCLRDGRFGITEEDQECVVIKELEYDI